MGRGRRRPLTPISPNSNSLFKPRNTITYGKRPRRSYKDRATTLFEDAVAQETQKPTKKAKRRVQFADPLTEEIPDIPFSDPYHPQNDWQAPQSFEEPRVNRFLSFDSDDEEEKDKRPSATVKLRSLIDEARLKFQEENDLEWYPETQPDDWHAIDESPRISQEDKNCSLLLI